MFKKIIQPTNIAVLISSGIHAVLLANLPTLAKLSEQNLAARTVPLIELSKEELARLPELSNTPTSSAAEIAASLGNIPAFPNTTLPQNPLLGSSTSSTTVPNLPGLPNSTFPSLPGSYLPSLPSGATSIPSYIPSSPPVTITLPKNITGDGPAPVSKLPVETIPLEQLPPPSLPQIPESGTVAIRPGDIDKSPQVPGIQDATGKTLPNTFEPPSVSPSFLPGLPAGVKPQKIDITQEDFKNYPSPPIAYAPQVPENTPIEQPTNRPDLSKNPSTAPENNLPEATETPTPTNIPSQPPELTKPTAEVVAFQRRQAILKDMRQRVENLKRHETDTTDEEARKNYLAWVQKVNTIKSKELTLNGTYPPDACFKELAGTSIYGVSLNEKGEITNVDLIKSSGYPILNQRAIADIYAKAKKFATEPEKVYQVKVNFEYNQKHCPGLTVRKSSSNDSGESSKTEQPSNQENATKLEKSPIPANNLGKKPEVKDEKNPATSREENATKLEKNPTPTNNLEPKTETPSKEENATKLEKNPTPTNNLEPKTETPSKEENATKLEKNPTPTNNLEPKTETPSKEENATKLEKNPTPTNNLEKKPEIKDGKTETPSKEENATKLEKTPTPTNNLEKKPEIKDGKTETPSKEENATKLEKNPTPTNNLEKKPEKPSIEINPDPKLERKEENVTKPEN